MANGKSNLKDVMKFKVESSEEMMEVFANGNLKRYVPIASVIIFVEFLQQINDD